MTKGEALAELALSYAYYKWIIHVDEIHNISGTRTLNITVDGNRSKRKEVRRFMKVLNATGYDYRINAIFKKQNR